MKFLPTFGVMLVLAYMVLFLFGDAIFRGSIYFWPVIIALVSSAVLCEFVKQGDRIDALEKQIKELEEKKEE